MILEKQLIFLLIEIDCFFACMMLLRDLSIDECVKLIKSCKTLSQSKAAHSAVLPTLQAQEQAGTHTATYLANLLVQMYASCGSVEECLSIFSSIKDKDIFSWNLMLSAYIQNSQVKEAERFFDRAMPIRDRVSWNTLLSAFSQLGLVEELQILFDSMPDRDVLSWTTLLYGYAQAGDLAESNRIFVEMPQRNFVSWTAVLTAYAQKGQTDRARDLFDNMPDRNLVSWNAMLNAYAQQGMCDSAKELFDRAPESDIVSWNSMLSAYSQNGQTDRAKRFFDSMPRMDVVSWNTLLTCFLESGDFSCAEKIFAWMPEKTIVSWNSMITAHSRRGHLECSKHLFDLMPAHDMISWNGLLAGYVCDGHLEEAKELFFRTLPVADDVVSWSIMVEIYSRNERIEKSKCLFDAMPMVRDPVSWNMVLAVHTHNDSSSKLALQMFSCMEMDGVVPNESTFTCVLQGCNHVGDVYLGWSYFCSMLRDRGLRACKHHFSCMVDLLGRAGYLGEAEDLISNMPFIPDVVDWLCLLGACSSRKDSTLVSYAGRKALELDPGNEAVFVLLRNMISEEDLHSALNL